MKLRIRAWAPTIIACVAALVFAQPASALQQNNLMAGMMPFFGAFLVVFLVVALVGYVYGAICLQTIARKTNTPNGWLAWIPVGNLVLMINIAKKPMWWLALFLAPALGWLLTFLMGQFVLIILVPLIIVNIVLAVMLWMGIAKARNKPEWWGILILVPLLNLVVPGYLAFSSDASGTAPQRTDSAGLQSTGQSTDPRAGATSLYCVAGEFAHDTITLPADGLYIGRDPSKVNLVLSSPEISGVHAYIRPDGGSQVSLEDWNSLNGTYYRSDALSEWVKLKGKIMLSRGAHFRLGDKVVEFEVRT